MKSTNITYWVSTVLFAGLMLASAIPNIMVNEDSVKFITHLGYPEYFIPFIGVGKALGAIAILIPGFARIKEWAYAGLLFDLGAATYSLIMVDGFNAGLTLMFVFMAVGAVSYFYHHKRLKITL
jgi:uncharacterized membrane protein YphA (DoxX/SURF4 family)